LYHDFVGLVALVMAEAVKVSAKAQAVGINKAVGGHFAEADVAPTPAAATDITDSSGEALSADELKAKKRAEIEAKLAALKLAQSKEAEQKAYFFGEHAGITCDGCGCAIVGYRYKCKDCPNHDCCENCYDKWSKGEVTNGLGKQTISKAAENHRLCLHKDNNFKSLVKKPEGSSGLTEKKEAKTKPNDLCPCGSGKKYKKCCQAKA
jgi:hypothetical protein